eukprot:scaffold375702_cov67-Attheya_sp.AAC.2
MRIGHHGGTPPRSTDYIYIASKERGGQSTSHPRRQSVQGGSRASAITIPHLLVHLMACIPKFFNCGE